MVSPLTFSNLSLSLFYKSDLVGDGTLSDDLYCLNLQNDTSLTAMHVYAGMKCCVVKEDSSMMWRCRLGHISQEMIKQLVDDGVLSTLDFTDYKTYVDWIN